jgi:hypothetical protein
MLGVELWFKEFLVAGILLMEVGRGKSIPSPMLEILASKLGDAFSLTDEPNIWPESAYYIKSEWQRVSSLPLSVRPSCRAKIWGACQSTPL